MPAIPATSFVLVTGGTGYIGGATVKDLLERGFSVRAAVRKQEGADFLLKANESYSKAGKLTTVIVPDIALDGAFDEHVKDVDGIMHLASPVGNQAKDPQESIKPALHGTTSIIQSAKTYGKKVKRVVVTSSVVAMVSVTRLTKSVWVKPEEWNEQSIPAVEKEGFESTQQDKYAASKILAERAARDLVKDAHFDIVTVHPTYTTGPWFNEIKDKKSIRSTVGYLPRWIWTEGPQTAIVDVRDVAALHSLSLIVQEASGERVMAANVTAQPADILEALRAGGIPGLPEKVSKAGEAEQLLHFNHDRTLEIFGPHGFKFHPWQQTVVDLAKQLDSRGFWGPPE